MEARIGRPRSCECGDCQKCKQRIYMRAWYASKTLDERRAMIARRDPERVRANDQARYRRDKPKRLALAREWTAKNREKARALSHANRRKWPEKVNARAAVQRAVNDGRLVRQPCRDCGNPKTQGHHPDYSKPLDVVWLCTTHHAEEHTAMRAAS